MKRWLLIIVLLGCVVGEISAQRSRTWRRVPYSKYGGGYIAGTEVDPQTLDTAYVVQLSEVIAFRSLGDIKRYKKLIRNVKAVYPYAVDARNLFNSLTAQLDTIPSQKERDKITRALEKEIVERYTPVLEKMTYTQGKILIRLIDRETERTSYQILEEFRGKFAAKFWNTIARIFRANLKQEYDPTQGEDKLIEQIIILYEAGLL
ncbi:MAG: DUF4294 domain-containing protein [Tidjanibacter sp.]|nr:DUF4294 domain-containing protein [Tidjanibacter sp.]